MANSTYKFIYFDVRGRGEVCRLLFAAAEQLYEDVRYPIAFKDGKPVFDEFKADQAAGKFPYGQVPVLEVEGQLIAQSHVIERFLAKRFGLLGKDDIEAAKIESVGEASIDIGLAYADARKADKKDEFFAETLPKLLRRIEDNAEGKDDGGALIGDSLSAADVWLLQRLNFFDNQDAITKILADLPRLKASRDLAASNKGIKNWIATRPVTAM